MLYPESELFQRLHNQIKQIPVIDCHEHMSGPAYQPPYKEPIAALTYFYMNSDLFSASFGIPLKDFKKLENEAISTDEKWPVFEKLWQASQHTAYARVTRLVLKDIYGEEEMTRDALQRMAEKLGQHTEEAYFKLLQDAGIKAVITDVLGWPPEPARFLEDRLIFPDMIKPMINLPFFHPTTLSGESVFNIGQLAGRMGTSLDEFVEITYDLFDTMIAKGCIGFKDQSAYQRTLNYEVPDKSEAEKQFNHLLHDPRNVLGWPQGKALNDYLMHAYMRFAREVNLPVQLHSGHMAGQLNRVDKANAALLTPLLELHQEVRFDLFHGNWPYMGDLLFLGKNYPNVSLNLCWLHIIDPLYASELMERAVMTIPANKVHAFGGDYLDAPEFSVAHLQIARENMAGTFARLVERGWLSEEESLCIAADWLYNNPNQTFNLGLQPYSPM
ncbi:MAG: amidohydrolase family protein [Anaerolineaceae bacterium]|nr:amidohydrolase family protein [Anaerolineaceae bacterium]